MEEKKIIDTEFTEVEEKDEKIEVDLSSVKPEDLMDLLDDVNHLVNGYSEIFAATHNMMHALHDKGYPMEKIVGTVNVLCKRASDKAAEAVGSGEKTEGSGDAVEASDSEA